ncbi:Putative vacuolar membrane protein (Fragment) [Durusdinium trenchii]|uniref:Vacuolar membrane protein n=1 Tax=Durusdinium trenchii TaxID=1381693 RepID=A0ABP0NFS0_9DINO
MAREAFIRLMEDLPKFSSVVMTNAARELGIELSSVGPGLMRDYIEKRCPLGDNRHLTQQAYLWAFAWETGFRSNKIELMAIASRGLVYIDQTAMDFNKTKFELASHGPARICQKNRLPNTLSPFSRLANASWVGANVAFMKDLDFHESKMKATSGTTKGVGAQEDGPEEAAGGASGGVFNGVQKEVRQFGYEPRDGSCTASEHEAFPGIHRPGGQFPVPIRCTEVVTAIATAAMDGRRFSFSKSQKKATALPPPSSSYLRPEADHHDELAGPWTTQVSS